MCFTRKYLLFHYDQPKIYMPSPKDMASTLIELLTTSHVFSIREIYFTARQKLGSVKLQIYTETSGGEQKQQTIQVTIAFNMGQFCMKNSQSETK